MRNPLMTAINAHWKKVLESENIHEGKPLGAEPSLEALTPDQHTVGRIGMVRILGWRNRLSRCISPLKSKGPDSFLANRARTEFLTHEFVSQDSIQGLAGCQSSLYRGVDIHIYIYICMYVYIYIYIYREREREIDR